MDLGTEDKFNVSNFDFISSLSCPPPPKKSYQNYKRTVIQCSIDQGSNTAYFDHNVCKNLNKPKIRICNQPFKKSIISRLYVKNWQSCLNSFAFWAPAREIEQNFNWNYIHSHKNTFQVRKCECYYIKIHRRRMRSCWSIALSNCLNKGWKNCCRILAREIKVPYAVQTLL